MKRMIWKSICLLTVLFGLSSMSMPGDEKIDFRNEFLTRVNKVRQQGCKCGTQQMPPAPPLVWNEQLEKAAQNHAVDMYKKHYFSHQSKDGRKIQDRIINAGYTFKGFRSYVIGENIAFGQESIEEVQNGWFKSEGHCRNLMNPDFKEIGVAWHNKYWVQDFGGREAFTPQQQLMIKKGARVIQKRG